MNKRRLNTSFRRIYKDRAVTEDIGITISFDVDNKIHSEELNYLLNQAKKYSVKLFPIADLDYQRAEQVFIPYPKPEQDENYKKLVSALEQFTQRGFQVSSTGELKVGIENTELYLKNDDPAAILPTVTGVDWSRVKNSKYDGVEVIETSIQPQEGNNGRLKKQRILAQEMGISHPEATTRHWNDFQQMIEKRSGEQGPTSASIPSEWVTVDTAHKLRTSSPDVKANIRRTFS